MAANKIGAPEFGYGPQKQSGIDKYPNIAHTRNNDKDYLPRYEQMPSGAVANRNVSPIDYFLKLSRQFMKGA